MILISAYYLFTRLHGIAGHMNEYFDYDEGTYLLIARLINHGYLPYRDIFAVHPPLFYYLLALWLRIFGDSYIVGRLFSVFLGFLSLIVAYYVGKEVRDWKLGIAFSGLLAMDPLLIHVNPLVFHETSIELFTLLSLYHFVRYAKGRNLKHAYVSLFWAGLGSTSKFTIIPYLLALYLVVVLSLDEKTWGYLKGTVDVLLNRTQVFIAIVTYLFMTLLCIAAVMLHPAKLLREIMVVPGIHATTLKGHIIPVMILLTFWALLTICIFRLSYFGKFLETLRVLFKNLKTELKLALFALIPKATVEGFLGVAVSRDYLSQTYVSQGGRFLPFLNLFYYMGKKFGDIRASRPEFLVYDVPLMVLLALVVLAVMKNSPRRDHGAGDALKILFMMNFFVYFFVSPIIPTPRFLYPMTLVLYLLLLDFLLSLRVSRREAAVAVLISLVFLSVADFGMIYRFPSGTLKLGWATKTKTLRDDLGDYIETKGTGEAVYYSVNPMNAYYLNLTVDPWHVDTFGLILLKGTDGRDMIENVRGSGDYAILSTWVYEAWTSSLLRGNLRYIFSFLHANTTLEYADSYDSGDVIEVYDLKRNAQGGLSFSAYNGKIAIWTNGSIAAYINLKKEGEEFSHRTRIMRVKNGTYRVIQYSNEGSVEFLVDTSNDGLLLDIPDGNSLEIEFKGSFVAFYDASGSFNPVGNEEETVNRLRIFTDTCELEILGERFLAKKTSRKRLEIGGERLKLRPGR
ncbi:glycosyltransferase family 39 protein [Thermococcus sp. P6]|uniref:ArnT family glycosyltransferase n=1 Tax=Thermococcus sp. P6 TaxID=122420 RepID=UPI0012FE05DE|nr:glycosyltransferase family 39 protein [Thermococcus sp. P6]